MASESAIFNKSKDCLHLFNNCIESMTTTRWPQDQLDRFNLWTAHGVIFGDYQKRTSMDWRLRDRPELVKIMLKLLSLLQDYLSCIYNLVDHSGESKAVDSKKGITTQDGRDQSQPLSSSMSSTSSTSSSTCSISPAIDQTDSASDPVATFQANVEQTIERLFRLSAVIRSAGMSYRYAKAANFVEYEKEVNLTQKFREGVELLFKHKSPSPCAYMVKRLVESICLRQRELAYSLRPKTEQKTGQETTKSHGVASLPPPSKSAYLRRGAPVSTVSKSRGAALLHEKEELHNPVPSAVYTATRVPTEVSSRARQLAPREASQKFDTIDDALDNLPPPPASAQKLEIECPYCAIPFEKAKFEGSAWRCHVLEDLRPYICILPDCKTPYAMYARGNSWKNHMQVEHKLTKWKCAATSHPEPKIIDTEADFVAHTMSEHKGAFTHDEILELANLGKYEVLRELDVDLWPECPLCTVSFEGQDDMAVYGHIAEDLVEYALHSLPESPYPVANQSQQVSSNYPSFGDRQIGQRRESEVETEKLIPWSLWEIESPQTETEVESYKADLIDIPDTSDTQVLVDIWKDVQRVRQKRLQMEPDPSQHLLREYKNELPYGITIFADGVDPVLDIVAIHGLNGHREKTWTVNEVNWLRDLLPSDIPNARIMSWGYDANTHSSSQSSAVSFYDHAITLISDLCLKRIFTKTQTRPIVFIAHSLGGIVLKSALIHSARQGPLEERRSIKLSTYGILFMGTPQGASGGRLGELMLNVASIFVAADDKILKHLDRDSEWLQQQLGQYAPISRDFVTKFAYEMLPTRIAGENSILVVPKTSAVVPGAADAEPVAIPADHLNMVKFASREDGGYKKVSGHLQLLAEEAPNVIGMRWEEQNRIKIAQADVKESFSILFSLSGIPKIDQFVGRKEELNKIKKAIQGVESRRKVVLLHGLGGIGKTQLAVAFAKEQKNAYSAVLWLNGKNEDTLKQSFAGMAKRLYNEHPSSALLRTAAEEKDVDQVVAIIKQWLSIKENTRWILIFDNIDNPKLPGIEDLQAYDIRLYFPEVDHGSILVTTRSPRLKIGKVVSIRKLFDIQENIMILASTSGREISDQDPHAIELVKQLDGLPLALATAGAYLNQVSTSLEDYLHYYRTSWLQLQQTSPGLLSYEDRALYTTWNLSFKHIRTQNESAGKLLRLWAYFDNQDLWYQLLAAGGEGSPEWFSTIVGDESSFNEAIRVLTDHALIFLNASWGYGMHPCVYAWVVHVLNAERQISMARLALTCVGLAVPTPDVPEYWAVERRLLPHAQKCLESVQDGIDLETQDNHNTLKAVNGLGNLYHNHGKLAEAEVMYQRVLKGKEKAWGPEHTSTLDTVNSLGSLYQDQGKLVEAEAMYQRALKGKEKAWGPEHTSTLDTVKSLGSLYQNQGKLAEAEGMYLRALKGYEKAWGPEHTSTLDTVNNLGSLYQDQGKLAEAEAMYRWALEGYEKVWGPEHTSTLSTVNNLGNLYADQGKMEEAEAMYRRALEGKERALGPEHASTLRTLNDLGNLYKTQRKMDEAKVMYERVH